MFNFAEIFLTMNAERRTQNAERSAAYTRLPRVCWNLRAAKFTWEVLCFIRRCFYTHITFKPFIKE